MRRLSNGGGVLVWEVSPVAVIRDRDPGRLSHGSSQKHGLRRLAWSFTLAFYL